VRGSLSRTGLVLFLLMLSSLIGTPVMSQFCGSHTGDLYVLPACAINSSTGGLADNAYLTSVVPQTAIALPGQNLTFSISYQAWRPTTVPAPGEFALLFTSSWEHAFPPGANSGSYFTAVYRGGLPSGPPGIKGAASLNVTAPIWTGTYYLWFSISFSKTLNTKYSKIPAHIKVIVSAHTSTMTVTAMIPGAVIQSPLNTLFVAAGVGGVAVAIALTSTALVSRRRRIRSIAEARSKAGFANLDELLLTVDTEVPKQDRVLATAMFTDIVSSTEWATKVGDREWQDLLSRHFGLVRKELDRFSGREIGNTGDGMLAVFADPERAVRCACSIRDAIRSLGLELRIGLHTGNMQLTTMAGLDHVAGIAVHIGARVAAQAQPGEILVSSTTKDLIPGSGIQFKDYGMHALKGVPGEWHLFAVTAA